MRKFHKILVLSVLVLFSCQVEQLDQSNLPREKKPDQTQGNSEDECETLFAIGNDAQSTCFIEDGFNRWGWTIGPLEAGEYTFDLYSGAGRCDIDKGTLVGELNVNYDELAGSLSVVYQILDGFVLNETHLYVGNDSYPIGNNGNPTVAPGQFPYQHELESASMDSYTIDGLSGQIYIIAHGVVCDDNEEEEEEEDDGGGVF